MKISFFLSAVLGLAAGGALGYSQGTAMGELIRSTEPLGAGFAVSDFAARQFHYADAEHARQAALLEISVLKQLKTVERSSISDSGLALAYLRLAKIERQAGNREAEGHAMEQARACSPHPRRGQDPSDDRLTELFDKMDAYGESPPSGSKVKTSR